MKLNATERRHLCGALLRAIEHEESLIDAYSIAFNKRGVHLPKVVPAEHRHIAARCRRQMAVYQKLLVKMRNATSTTRSGT